MKKLIYIILPIFLLTSCLGSKKIFDKTTEIKEQDKSSIIKDSTANTETSGAIEDRIVINIPESDNEEVTAMFEALMKQLNTSKSSGNNSYQLRYDEELKQLIADFKIAQTQNKKTEVNSDAKSEISYSKVIDEYIEKKIKIMPWWIYVIIAFFLRKHIIGLIAIFIPGVSNIKTAKDLFTAPKK
jgi:hypothetical protein